MRRILPAILLALAVVLASVASAAVLATSNAALLQELTGRAAALPPTGLTKDQKKQKSALAKSTAALNRDGKTPSKTLADAVAVAAALDAVYPSDATLGPLLDGMIGEQQGIAVTRLQLATRRNQGLPATDKTHVKVGPLLLQANAAITGYDTAPTRALKVNAIVAAVKLVDKAEKALDKALRRTGGPDVKTTAYHVEIDGAAFDLPATGVTNYQIFYAPAGIGSLTINAAGPIGAVQHSIALVVPSPGVGDRLLASNSNYFSMPGVGMLPMTSGTVHLSTFAPDKHKVAGTFNATYSNGTTTVTLTNGRFSTTDMKP